MTWSTLAICSGICTIITFIVTWCYSGVRFRRTVVDRVVKDINSQFGEEFVPMRQYKDEREKTYKKLEEIKSELIHGNKEFTVLRLILSEAKLLPQERIDTIRNTVLNGDHK